MTTKKPKAKKVGRPSKGERAPVIVRFKPEILKALDDYLEVIGEERAPFIQSLVRDHLTQRGLYPPKL